MAEQTTNTGTASILGLEVSAAAPAPAREAAPPIAARLRRAFLSHFRWEVALLAAIGMAALALRLWPMQIAHWWDEAAYLQNAEAMFFGKLNYSELNFRPPLLSILFGLGFKLWHNALAASLVVAVLNTLGVLFLAAAARRLYGRGAGLAAGAMAALAPMLADNGRTLMTDDPCAALTAAALFFVVCGHEAGSPLWPAAVAGVLTAAATLMRFTGVLALLPLVLLIAVGARRVERLFLYLAAFTAAFSPYLLWSRVHFGGWLAPIFKGMEQVGDINEARWFYLRNLPAAFAWPALAGVALWLLACALPVVPAIADYRDGWILMLRRRVDALRAVDGVLLLWSVVVFAYFTQVPHKELRYIVPAAVPLFMLAARGWSRLFGRAAWQVVAILAFSVFVVWSASPSFVRFRQPFLNTYVTEEIQAADYLNRLPKIPGAVLYPTSNFPVFGYYTRLPIVIPVPSDDGFFSAFPRNMVSGGYAVLYKSGRNPSPEWADRNPDFRRLQEFPSFVIYAYKLR